MKEPGPASLIHHQLNVLANTPVSSSGFFFVLLITKIAKVTMIMQRQSDNSLDIILAAAAPFFLRQSNEASGALLGMLRVS